jgi:cytochrome c biogenesis protein
VTYPDGQTQSGTEPFQPQDSSFTSQGAVKFADPPGYVGDAVRSHQLAIVGLFAPTALIHGGIMTSTFPAAEAPGVAIQIYRGDLGMETGKAQSIFAIDADQVANGKLVKLNRANLAPGESMKLDDGTKITFTGYKEWVSLQTSFDPAEGWALVFAISLLVGLMSSLVIKRRRVWFRISPSGAGAEANQPSDVITAPAAAGGVSVATRTVAVEDRIRVDIGGLARTDQAGYGDEFTKLVALVDGRQQ